MLGVAGVALRERDLGPHLGVSVAMVVLAAALPLSGPSGAVLVGATAYALDPRRNRWRTRAFNVAMTGFLGAGGGLVYLGLGGLRIRQVELDPVGLLLRVGLPLLVAYAAMTALNAVAIAVMLRIMRGTPTSETVSRVLRSLGWGYLTHVVVAFLFAVLWGPAGLGALSALFVLGPLLVAHWSIGREVAARREHQETVTTFVAALEQADPASVGHSARVADLVDRIAAGLGIRGQAAEDLRYAALVHDIGMVAVRPELATGADREPLTRLSVLSGHPVAGVDVLRGLDFLTGALPAVRHHHERLDGRGYPAGLRGDQIPLAARVIAVADAYDALTVDRGEGAGDPVTAVAELRRRAGTHLDPEVVEALASALGVDRSAPAAPQVRSDGATRSAVPEAGGASTTSWVDHDDPRVSDAYARWRPESLGRPR
ncbi:HD-GYP domain-containing protein [Ornithinimicrobium sp. W1679]|uniref:HD-GYP domain-containing protein n=1 Tax=unclassified Ornithinimicrobium TaxID=2615080 RepID=UPI003CEF3303